jgi:hypothetical protein
MTHALKQTHVPNFAGISHTSLTAFPQRYSRLEKYDQRPHLPSARLSGMRTPARMVRQEENRHGQTSAVVCKHKLRARAGPWQTVRRNEKLCWKERQENYLSFVVCVLNSHAADSVFLGEFLNVLENFLYRTVKQCSNDSLRRPAAIKHLHQQCLCWLFSFFIFLTSGPPWDCRKGLQISVCDPYVETAFLKGFLQLSHGRVLSGCELHYHFVLRQGVAGSDD